MALLKFKVETMADIDGGRLKAAIEKQLKRCVDDCKDRASLDKPRKVMIELCLTPVADDTTGEAEQVWLDYQVKTAIPSLHREGLSLGLQKNGDLLFNEHSPGNVDQRTVFDDENDG